MMVSIERAEFPLDLDSVLDIYREYVSSTSACLEFQDNEADFETLAEQYSSAAAGIFLARIQNGVVGCAAYRKVNSHTCEMKRVYV